MEPVRTVVNLELAVADEIVELACLLRPMPATLVPEGRQEITTEGGLALGAAEQRARVRRASDRLRQAGIRTSLFIAPDPDAVAASRDLGVERSSCTRANTRTRRAATRRAASSPGWGWPPSAAPSSASRCTRATASLTRTSRRSLASCPSRS
jgi:pyridoxine 5-phosphate synthase